MIFSFPEVIKGCAMFIYFFMSLAVKTHGIIRCVAHLYRKIIIQQKL